MNESRDAFKRFIFNITSNKNEKLITYALIE
jgi:hypothetical protein